MKLVQIGVIALALGATACGVPSQCDASTCAAGGGGPGGGAGANWGNAAALLNGKSFGLGVATNSLLTKVVTTNATGDARFQIISSTLTREAASDESSYLTIHVRNVGTTGACFIAASPLVYSGSGEALDAGDAFVAGASHTLGNLTTSTCLGAGEDGFLTDITVSTDGGAFYSTHDTVTFTWTSSAPGTLPAARLIPIAYDAGSVTVDVVARNEGTRTATQALVLGRGVLIDTNGRGFGWSFLFGPGGALNTDAGAISHFELITFSEGTASALYANLGDYEDCQTCVRAPHPPRTVEERRALHQRLRDRDLELRDQLVK